MTGPLYEGRKELEDETPCFRFTNTTHDFLQNDHLMNKNCVLYLVESVYVFVILPCIWVSLPAYSLEVRVQG